MNPFPRAGLAFAASLGVLITTPVSPAAADPGPRTAVWQGAIAGPQPLPDVSPLSPPNTVRMVLRASAGSHSLRVRFSNRFGTGPLTITAASLGIPVVPSSSRLVADSLRPLRFDGRRAVTIPAGRSRYSDPVTAKVSGDRSVAVSVYAPGQPINDHFFPPFAGNPPATYVGRPGNHVDDPTAKAFPLAPQDSSGVFSPAVGYHPGVTWWADLITGRTRTAGAVVALGDSITDGYSAIGAPGQRWTDILAQRFTRRPAGRQLSVVNAGISGNTVGVQPNPWQDTGACCGEPMVKRLRRDVLTVPGVRAVILLGGTNDLSGGEFAEPRPASAVIRAQQKVIRRARAADLRVYGATLIPMSRDPGSPIEQNRQLVNDWIRTEANFDAVIDFDRMIRWPKKPWLMRPSLLSTVGPVPPEHPNAAGHLRMAMGIDLSVFDGLLAGK